MKYILLFSVSLLLCSSLFAAEVVNGIQGKNAQGFNKPGQEVHSGNRKVCCVNTGCAWPGGHAPYGHASDDGGQVIYKPQLGSTSCVID